VITILKKLYFGGALGSAIDRDVVLGTWFQLFTQSQLAQTYDYKPIDITSYMWQPYWAYTLHGSAHAHHRIVYHSEDRPALPSDSRLEVYTKENHCRWEAD